MENCAFCPLKIYLEYLDTDKMRRPVEKPIWGQIKWEAKSRKLWYPLSMSNSGNLSYKSKHLDQSLQAKEYVEHGCWQWWVPLLLWLVVLLLVVLVVLPLVVLVVLLLVVLVVLLLLDLSSPPSPSHLNRVSCSSVCSPPCKTWVQQGWRVKLREALS